MLKYSVLLNNLRYKDLYFYLETLINSYDYIENSKYFKENGYVVEFKKTHYIMSPALYQRIYKGALGEEIRKLKQGIKLMEIDNPKHFERFDYYYKDAYFDFKNWDRSYLVEESKQIKKVIKKAKEVGANQASVINLYSLKDSNITYTID